MKNFTYRSHDEKENIEEILRQRKRKVNRQQIVAATVLGVILVILGLYFGRKVVYSDFDGYIHVDANQVRTPFDIFLDSLYVETGDIVMPGDTLYSYFMMDIMSEQANINTEPTIVARNRDLTLRHNSLLQEIAVQKVRIAELRKQISLENHNIQFGLSDNSHRMDLERMLNEALAMLKAMQAEAGMLAGMRHSTDPSRRGIHGGNGAQVYDNIGLRSMQAARRYRLATDSAIIVNIVAPDRMVFFEKELLMTAQHLNLTDNNLHVVAYIPPDKIHNITYNSLAEIVVNENLSFDAHVSIIGMRTEEIPENLRSYFTKKNTALIAKLDIDFDQRIPFWSVASGLPVTIRIKNLDTWKSDSPSNYLWVTTGAGVSEESLVEYQNRRRHYSVIERRIEEQRADSIKRARKQQRADSLAALKQREDSALQAERQRQLLAADSAKVFYIITNVYNAERHAADRVAELNDMALMQSGKLNRSGKWYVYASRHSSADEAAAELKTISRTQREFRDAWILDTRKPEKK